MGRLRRPRNAKDQKRRRDALARIDSQPEWETCEASGGKRIYHLESDVLMAYRHVKIPTRAYDCPFCPGWHATSQPLKTRPVDKPARTSENETVE